MEKNNLVARISSQSDSRKKLIHLTTQGEKLYKETHPILLKSIKTNPDLDELSKSLFISKSTLDKRIRKLTNKNISQYIREFKIQYAMKLIHLGERNIQYLVDETGFASFSYFSTSFCFIINTFFIHINKEKNIFL